jgi:Uma2 family endonuclease
VAEKVANWLAAGTQVVWVVDPKLRTVTVHESDVDAVTLTEQDQLEGGDVVPGFRIAVAKLFET